MKELKNRIEEYKNSNTTLHQTEKDLIEILLNFLDYFHCIIINNKNNIIFQEKDELLEIHNRILKYFKDKGHLKEEFHILDENDFDNSNKYLSNLLNNLYFYFSDYIPNIELIHIYYYLFHLIYYLLLIIVESKEKNSFEDKNIKFYIYHITHFFKKDKTSPEYCFFFYEGAFKFLSKRYNISIKYIFTIDSSLMEIISSTSKINSIINEFYMQIIKENKSEQTILNFIKEYKKIKQQIDNILNQQNGEINYNIGDTENLIRIYGDIDGKIHKILNIFNNNKVKCEMLEAYEKKLKELSDIISNNNLTDNHFVLMLRNYPKNTIIINNETLLDCARKWVKYNDKLNEDYTKIFSEIINSNDFKQLYLTAMKSKKVEDFAKKYDLLSNYRLFMDKYAEKIDKYILYMPLAKGIKSYISNYFKIVLNINSLELIGKFDEEQKIEVYKSYLLVELLYESFHFIYRIDKKDLSCKNVLSPVRKKLMMAYGDIGVDIIFHLFGTEYINFFPLKNCKLLNSLESWSNDETEFKVFNQVYLVGNELITVGEDKGIGLKCDISLFEDSDNEWKLCTDSAIRYCY